MIEGKNPSTVAHWLKKHGLGAPQPPRRGRGESRKELALAARQHGRTRFRYECKWHGFTDFLAMPSGRSRCAQCNSEAVLRCRRNRKETLALEAGGACKLCGYDEHLAALQFHHLDPKTKEFGIAEAGVTRSLEKCREEAKKCILLCSNCHAAFEAGAITLPLESNADPEPE
ncbi:MAG: hypothetical protein QOI31_2565 [Solirubrobacterales bacterium]|nr:hypothetical protein [Solirubrobacterales bacterium]